MLSVKMLDSKEITPLVDVVSFGVRLPVNIFDVTANYDNVSTQQKGLESETNFLESQGIVGTITFLGPLSAMIWIGFGSLIRDCSGITDNQIPKVEVQGDIKSSPTCRALGASTTSCMGPMYLSMPRSRSNGAFSDSFMGSTSKLIGDGSGKTHVEMIAQQMSSRLSQRLNIAVFVSYYLDETQLPTSKIDDEEVVASRAAALAEREVYRILKEKLSVK